MQQTIAALILKVFIDFEILLPYNYCLHAYRKVSDYLQASNLTGCCANMSCYGNTSSLPN